MAKLNVLHVDDEPELLDITKMLLEQDSELKVDIEQDPVVALDRMAHEEYDVIVSDYRMSGMSGIELLKKIRESDQVPFILFTGRGREEVAIEALNNGADLYLQKGGDPEAQFMELRNAIIQLAQRKKAEVQVIDGERKYRELVEGANEIILELDPIGNITFLNTFGRTFFSCGDEVIGKPVVSTLFRDCSYPGNKAEKGLMKSLLVIDGNTSDTYQLRHQDVRVSFTIKVIHDTNNNVLEYLFVGNDVTAAKKAELKLQRSNSLTRAMLDSSNEAIHLTDNNGNIMDLNQRFLDMWEILPN